MALVTGNVTATTGMAKTIYDVIKDEIVDKLEKKPEKVVEMETQLKKLSYCIAKGVIEHIVSNMEIGGITVSDAARTVETYVAGVGDHTGALSATTYPVAGTVKSATRTLSQNNSGTGRVS